jgi:hypothetical protein
VFNQDEKQEGKMTILIHLTTQSNPITRHDIKNAYTKGSLYCVKLEDGRVEKYPLCNIFRIEETQLDQEIREALNDKQR